MAKKKEILATLAILKNGKPPRDEDVDDIQACKDPEPEPEPEPEQESQPLPSVKVKKPRSEKQMEEFNRMQEKGMEKRAEKKEDKYAIMKVKKEEKENRIVKTALTIKMKEKKREAILEEVSDDDEDESPTSPKLQRTRPIKEVVPRQPQFMFV